MQNRYDMLVIGGGIHGVGVAQAAAAAGYSVLVLEQKALASATSSRSSKLIHGGLRYLETFQLSLVRESLRERELLIRLAPDLVHRRAFFIPVYRQTSRAVWKLRAGLSLYSILAGLGRHARFRSIPRSKWADLDGLVTKDLKAVLQYSDAQTDDAALTRAVMRSAESLGAELCCPASFLTGKIESDGCDVRLQYDGVQHQVRASVVVNAAGPWASRLHERFQPQLPAFQVENVQGTHVELPGRIRKGCYYLEVPVDRRAIFVMPWHDRTLLGTTEYTYDGDPGKAEATAEEVDYLLDAYQHFFPDRDLEVIDAWAGLRVLPSGGTAFNRPRETQLPVDNEAAPRVVSVFGGKLTGYRATALKVLKRLAKTLPPRPPVASTDELELA